MACASEMLLSNSTPNLKIIFKKICLFTTKLSFSSNTLICAIEQFWIVNVSSGNRFEKCTSKFYLISHGSIHFFYTLYIIMYHGHFT